MANPLPNTTTTANFRDTIIASGGPCQGGSILIANNPVQMLVESGPESGTTHQTLYPYVAPSIIPLAAGKEDFIWSVSFANLAGGGNAQVSGWLIPYGLAGPAGGNPFTATITPTGVIVIGSELAYNEYTAPVSINTGTEGTANTIVTASAFTADGSSKYLIDFFCPDVVCVSGDLINVVLYEDGSSIGRLATIAPQGTGGITSGVPCFASRRYQPVAGSHTYSIRAYRGSGANADSFQAGIGGNGNILPGFVRITQAA